jgi:hypothetical protein
MDYLINIPSYQRSEVVASRTLSFLDKHNIDRERVTVWVANEQEFDTYRKHLDTSWRIGVSEKGLVQSRCHYHQQAPKGTPILNIDDDISDLLTSDGKRLQPFASNLDKFITEAFTMAEENNVKLWGINGAANAMFLKPQATVGLRYIIGAFFGSYAHDPIFNLDNREGQSSGEDFEATLMAFTRDGAVLRFDGISIKTAYFASGGIDAELKELGITQRQTDHKQRLEQIANKYKGLASIYSKAGDVTNIRLKVITAHRMSWKPQ